MLFTTGAMAICLLALHNNIIFHITMTTDMQMHSVC